MKHPLDCRPEVPIMESAPGPVTRVDGKEYLYFGGTSYLGLGSRPEVLEAACAALRCYGIHTATSRSGFGNSPLVTEVERRAAEFFGSEGAFYTTSGYSGGHILLQALCDRCDVLLADEVAHYCLNEAARLLGKPTIRFRHADCDDLQQKLRRHVPPGGRPLVVTDGVFSISGAVAPIDRYAGLLKKYGTASLVVDDAHGFGVLGANGRGTVEQAGLWSDGISGDPAGGGIGIYVCGTLSKALGGFGGILPGSSALLQRVRATSHYYEGASAPMAAAAGASARALEIVGREPELRERLCRNARRLREGLRRLGLEVADSPTPIIGLTIGRAADMERIHTRLRAAGILVPYFASYAGTGPEGRLRIAVFATHTDEMLDRLAKELAKLV